jgi:hypothetical protein
MRVWLYTVLLFLPITAANSFQKNTRNSRNSKNQNIVSPIRRTAEDLWQRSLAGNLISDRLPGSSLFAAKDKNRKGASSSGGGSSRRTVLLGGTVLLTPLFAEGFARLGTLFLQIDALEYPQVPPDVTEITIVFHGANGLDENTDVLMKNLETQTSTPYNFMMNWTQYSQNLVQASFNGDRIGQEVAKRLPAHITKVHIIGISVGAAAADACVVQLKKDRPDNQVYIQETLLDPLCARGVLDLTYGEREFGAEADYAQQILNTDDPVPFTNAACTKCATLDITLCRPPEIFGHDWPLIFYANWIGMLGFVDDSKKLKEGVVFTVNK